MDKKFFFQILGLVILIFGAIALTFNQQLIPNLGKKATPIVVSSAVSNGLQIIDAGTHTSKATLLIELADTKDKRAQGLSGRPALAAESGMLFLMESRTKPTFWMKGMQIPLDFIWIDGDKVVDLIENVPPPVSGQSDQTLLLYSPKVEVDKVLEVNAGYIASHRILLGDIIVVGTVTPSP